MIDCTYCGNEAESPRLDDVDDPICFDCYHEHYEFTCCWCQEDEHQDHQHKMLVLVDPKGAGIAVGIYRIVSLPYYADGMIEGFLFESALEHLRDLPEGIDTRGYPCGHLCRDCQKKAIEG